MNGKPLRVLFLCTANSARSQMAEALLNFKGGGRFHAESAGSHPAERVNPLAVLALKEAGIEWRGHRPRGLDGLEEQHWDIVITVCDDARDACPIFRGAPVMAHWGMADPAKVGGTPTQQQRAFSDALRLLAARIDSLLTSTASG